jgi:2-oxoglutarate dehydrogenase E2 component (dihydrolipoamide succinyltransferase)
MPFFTKAVVVALQKYPIINAYAEDNYIVYHNYYDIGIINNFNIILRNAELMSFADIERNITDLSKKNTEQQLAMEELTDGTFTIVNLSDSMLSTPNLNPSQSAVLGIHNTIKHPTAKDGKIIISPMMFIALSFDRRLIESNKAVQFLNTVKNLIEDPFRLLLEV